MLWVMFDWEPISTTSSWLQMSNYFFSANRSSTLLTLSAAVCFLSVLRFKSALLHLMHLPQSPETHLVPTRMEVWIRWGPTWWTTE